MYYKTADGSSDDVQDAIDDDTPDSLTPSEIVGAYMSGEMGSREFFENSYMSDKFSKSMTYDYLGLLDVIRHYKRDPILTDDENIREKMAQINEFLDECLLEYVGKT